MDEIQHVHQEHHLKLIQVENLEFDLIYFHQMGQVDLLFHFQVRQVFLSVYAH